ncbi:MAG: multiheme c-type cytochrome [Polyangia bacterium]
MEPCGCTSDPLGDISRLAALVEDTRKSTGDLGGVALLDAGGLLYPEGGLSPRERPSADLRAEFLAAQFERIGLLGSALGETDLVGGTGLLRPARLASNLPPAGVGQAVRPPRVDKVGGIAIGVLGIGDPAVADAVHAKGEEMLAAARRDVDRLRQGGAEVVILLAAVEKAPARRLARDSGADIVVVGKRVGAGMPRLERVGRAFIVAPSDEMQRVGRLDIVLRGSPLSVGAPLQLQDAGGADVALLRRQEINRALERLELDLSRWTRPSAKSDAAQAADTDDGFIAAKRREKTELEAEKKRLDAPWVPPATGSYLTNTLVPLRRTLRRDAKMVAAMKKLDQRIAAVNLKHASPPPPPEAGRPFYVGMDRCTSCHAAATRFWKGTVHAHAWKTLVQGGKQADYKCVGCHVTGFGQVGGSSLGFTKKLETVQCETCHGPGSAHVAGEGNEEPLAIKRDTPETVCLACHTEQHSDTFKYEPYLRDIVGPGHGPARRQKLGAGATGHELRSRALAQAKLAGAAQLKQAKP